MQAAKKPEYNEDDQNEAEHTAQPASSVAIVAIVAATAAKQQDQDDDDQESAHLPPRLVRGVRLGHGATQVRPLLNTARAPASSFQASSRSTTLSREPWTCRWPL